MVTDADLSADDGVIADDARSGDAGLSGDNHVVAYGAVVADVDEVVDLYATGDAGFVEGSAIDGGVGADFHVVFDDEAALLRELRVLAAQSVADIAEAVGAEDCSGVDDDAVAEFDSGIDDDAWIDAAVVSDVTTPWPTIAPAPMEELLRFSLASCL